MAPSRVVLAAAGAACVLAGCDGCRRSDPSPATTSSASPSSGPSALPAPVVAESLPRCRADGARVTLPGEDVVVGEAVVGPDALFVGVVRREGTRRVQGVVRASLDLASVRLIDVGPALGDDPPPSPRLHGGAAMLASFVRAKGGGDGGAAIGAMGATRVLELARIEASGLVAEASIVQQADESLAYDVAWSDADKAPGLVAWDEDAPPRGVDLPADRGVVKVQLLGAGTRARVASSETSDAEAPRLLARPGGYWLAWLARRSERSEAAEDAGAAAEGPGERRAYRWVELVALDAKGEAASPVRRVTPEKGRVASFELARDGALFTVLVQDEAAQAEGSGERILRYVIDGETIEASDLLDGGVGHALADLIPAADDAGTHRWLSFTDTQERAHLVPLGLTLRATGPSTIEPILDGVRVLGTAPPDALFAIGPAGGADGAGGRVEVRRLVCR